MKKKFSQLYQYLNSTQIFLPNQIPLFWILAFIFGILTAIYCVRTELPIYVWDLRRSWDQYNILANLSSFLQLSKTLFYSLFTSEYNYATILPLLPFHYFLGGSRISFITSIVVVYLVPLSLYLGSVTTKIIQRYADPKYFTIFAKIIPIFALTIPNIWGVTIKGYVDVAGLIPLLGAYACYKDLPITQKLQWQQWSKLGLLLWLPFLLRRWYAFAVTAFFMSVVIVETLKILQQPKGERLTSWKYLIFNLFLAGCTIILLTAIFQWQQMWEILRSNYSDLYDAYQRPLNINLSAFFLYLGHLNIGILVYGILFFTIYDRRAFYDGLFFLLNMILYSAMFFSVQSMGIHHYLPNIFWGFFLLIFGVYWIFQLFKDRIWQICFLTFISFCWLTIFIASIFDPQWTSGVQKYFIFLNYHSNTFFQGEEQTVFTIADTLQQLAVQDPQATFVVWGSDGLVSTETMLVIGRYRQLDYPKNMFIFPQVDKRDGFLFQSLTADYAIVTEPPMTLLNSEKQYILTVPSKMFQENTGIAKAYQPLPQQFSIIDLDGKLHTIKIYRRLRRISQKEVEQLYEIFQQHYPNWNYDYSIIQKHSR